MVNNNINDSSINFNCEIPQTGKKRVREDCDSPPVNLESFRVSALTPERIRGDPTLQILFHQIDEIVLVILRNLDSQDLLTFSLTSKNNLMLVEEELIRRFHHSNINFNCEISQKTGQKRKIESFGTNPLTPERIRGGDPTFQILFNINDIVLIVLRDLGPQELITFSLTSKNNFILAENEIIRRLNEGENFINDFFPKPVTGIAFLEKHCLKIRKLDFSQISARDIDWKTLFQQFENLQALIVNGSQLPMNFAFYFSKRASKCLKIFEIEYGNFFDFKCLEGTGIEELSIKNCQLTDIKFLLKLPYLKKLTLKGCLHIVDFTPIIECKFLKSLDLSASNITEISFIDKFNLDALNLARCDQIQDFSPLTNANLSISTLDLSETKFSDIELISKLPLTKLSLKNCLHINDFSPLKQCMSLKDLEISTVNFDNLELLKDLPIQNLNLSLCTRIKNYSVLKYFKQLRDLHLPPNCSNISFLKYVPLLTTLILESTEIVDMKPLRNCPHLKSLSFTCAKVMTDIDFLKNCKLLEKLYINTRHANCCINLSDLVSFKLIKFVYAVGVTYYNIEKCIKECHKKFMEKAAEGGILNFDPEYIKFLYKLATLGDSHAQLSLGCKLKGNNISKAFHYLKMSADRGDAEGENTLGFYFLNAIGTEKNEKKAFKYFKRAAEKNNCEGQYNLGYCFEFGVGIEKNLKEALHYYSLSSIQKYEEATNKYHLLFSSILNQAIGGDAEMQNLAGELYQNHFNDPSLALYFHKRSAENGNPLGQYNLGICYETGYGFEAPLVDKAICLYELSAKQGNDRAKERLEALIKEQLVKETHG